MASWSKKIYLSFWLSLLFFTAIAALWLPGLLDQGKNESIKGLEAAPKFNFSEADLSQVVTRFPTRPFLEKAPNPEPVPVRTPFDEFTPAENTASSGGLPTRFVPGVENTTSTMDERVTTRAYLRANSSVYAQAQTTAAVLGRVGDQTKVRWLDKAGEGWEEILLKDGRSAFVQSTDLSFSADSRDPQENSFTNQRDTDSGPDIAKLPGTVESFLATLSSNDLLRAETYLSPLASGLDRENLGSLTPYAGSSPLGRVLRIELVPGDRSGYRLARLVYGDSMDFEAATLWEWDQSQQRWLLVRWD